MMKLGLLASTLVVSALLASPAMAGHVTHHQAEQVCDPRDPGNPFSKKYDYMTWSAWRRRGAWDDRADYTCQPIPTNPWGTTSKW